MSGICSAVHSTRGALAPFPVVAVHCVVRGATRKINLQLETNWPVSFQFKFIFGIRHGSASAHRVRSGTVPGPCALAAPVGCCGSHRENRVTCGCFIRCPCVWAEAWLASTGFSVVYVLPFGNGNSLCSGWREHTRTRAHDHARTRRDQTNAY